MALPKRNRKQRAQTTVYRLEHYLKDGTPHPIDEDRKFFVEGNVEGMLIVSVPEDTPTRVCQNIQKLVADKVRQDVLVVTHNITFMRAVPVSRKEGAQIIKMHQDVPEKEEPRILT